MKRSMSDSNESSLYGRCEDDDRCESNRSQKKPKTEEDDDVSSTKTRPFGQRDLWVLTSFLGKGSYGSVHLAVRTTEGEKESLPKEMVIKTTEFSQASRLKNEAEFLTRLEDIPYVVSYYGNETTQDKKSKMLYNTILEYCPGQCLAKLIKLHRGIGLAEESVKIYAMSVLIGLKHIHEKKIIHCDIKPKNILLAAEKTGEGHGFVAKISGFGKAMEKGSSEYGDGCGHVRGTTRFMSPELIGDKILDYGADVWAFGCTVLEMLTGERVWAEHGEMCWEEWITLIGESDLVPYVPTALSEEAKDFLSKSFNKDPARRWTVDSLMDHPFVRWNNEYSEEKEDAEEDEIFEEEEEEIFEEEEEEEEEEIFEKEEAIEIDEEYPQEESEEAIEIDEEYPKEESEEEDLSI